MVCGTRKYINGENEEINTNIKQANPQEGLHPKTPINVAKIIGNRASPKVKPRLVKATVFPLFFENHLPHNTIDK